VNAGAFSVECGRGTGSAWDVTALSRDRVGHLVRERCTSFQNLTDSNAHRVAPQDHADHGVNPAVAEMEPAGHWLDDRVADAPECLAAVVAAMAVMRSAVVVVDELAGVVVVDRPRTVRTRERDVRCHRFRLDTATEGQQRRAPALKVELAEIGHQNASHHKD
jgi:hypothetical protein